jgi:hypothetical protein
MEREREREGKEEVKKEKNTLYFSFTSFSYFLSHTMKI